nr:type II secretion system protein GspC [Sansalvadorimonas sp. 2012CJ34-2]
MNFQDVGQRLAKPFFKNQKRFILLLEVLLVVVLMYQLAGMFWQIWDSNNRAPASANISLQTQEFSSNDIDKDRFASLDSFELFGKEQVQVQKPVPAKVTSIPRSRLPAKVTGLLAFPDSETALAIIETRGRQRSYRIGDTVDGIRAKIVSIYPDRVIVEEKGKKQALMLYPDQKTSTLFEVAPRVENKEPMEQISAMDIIANPQKLTELVNISPVRVKGELKGYRINPGKQSKLFVQAGLKPNDLVVEINGSDLTDPAAAMAFLENLDAFERIDLTVEREGMLHQVELSL